MYVLSQAFIFLSLEAVCILECIWAVYVRILLEFGHCVCVESWLAKRSVTHRPSSGGRASRVLLQSVHVVCHTSCA